MTTWGFPYSGSKSAFADSLAMNFPKADHFYDLFGGGGSMTHFLLMNSKKFKHVHYNELDNKVFDLFKRAVNGDFNDDKFKPEWVSREDFFRLKDSDPYVKYICSFSNNGSAYQFCEQVEPYKKSMHMAVVFNEFDDLAKEALGFSSWPKGVNSINQKRFYLRQKIEFYRVNNRIPKCLHQFIPNKQLQRLEQLERLQQLQQLKQLQQLERLERLQQLQQLERLEQLGNLVCTNLDYRSVEIENNSVVYCDIPYLNAAKTITYIKNGFDHSSFYDWALSRKFPIFISEYYMPDDFTCVYTLEKRNLYSPSIKKNNINEKLYWNGIKI